LIRGKDNWHRFVIVASYFIAFAENVTEAHRFQSIKDFIGALELMYHAGMASEEHLERERALCKSCLMGLNDDNDDLWMSAGSPQGHAKEHLLLNTFSFAVVGETTQNWLQ